MRHTTIKSLLCFTLVLGMSVMVGCKDDHSHAGHDHSGHDHHDHAGHTHPHDTTKSSTTAQQAATQVKFVNVMCPVGDEKINPASKHTVTVEHEGQTYALCCADCVEPFKKEPAKYLAKLAAPTQGQTPAAPTMPQMQ